jgi:hypothetical protein
MRFFCCALAVTTRSIPRRSVRVAALTIVVASLLVIASLALTQDARADLFAVTDRGEVFRSTTGGATWSLRGTVSEPAITGLTPGSVAGTLYLAGAAGDVYRSTDAGASWLVVGSAGASDCEDIVIDRGGDLLVLTASGDFARSSNGGVTWTPQSNAGFSDGVALAIGAAMSSQDQVFAFTASGDVASSVDGASWNVVGSTGYTPVIDAAWTDGVLRAMTDAGELLVSTNAGVSWSAAGTASQVGMRAFTVDSGKLLAITKEGDVAQSTTGAAWSWIGTVNQVFVVALAPGLPEFVTSVGGPSAPQLAVRAFPNPFTDEIQFALSGLPAQTPVEISVFDTAGRRVARVHSGALENDPALIRWQPRDTAAGVYFLRVNSDRFSETQRIVFIR